MTVYFETIFERDKHRCVYCGRWMLSDFDTFMLTEEDHLLPRNDEGADDETNRVTSCRICNMLKGDYSAGRELYFADRAAYIQKVRDFIGSRRAQKLADFFSWTHTDKNCHGKE
jgi:hypothetical protein